MRRLLALLVAGSCLWMTSCASGAEDDFILPVVGPAELDVDTAELRGLKRQAGIQPCPSGTGSSELPAVTLPCLGGGPDVTLDRLTGPLVVTVWAQWCGPCERELPILARFADEYAGRVDVLGIDYTDQFPADAIRLLRESGARFPQVADFGGAIRGEGPFPALEQVPMLALVDESGRVHVEIVALKSYDQLTALVDEHIGLPT